MGRCRLRQREVRPRVTGSCRDLVALLSQAIESEPPDRLEQAEPDTATTCVRGITLDEALIDQLGQHVQDVAIGLDDGLRLLEIETALENGEVVEGVLGRRGQELVAPRDGAVQRALSIRHVAGSRAG